MTADIIKQFQVMSLIMSPPVIDRTLAVAVTRPLLCVTIIDPNDAPPYTYRWTQGGGAPPGAAFETPTGACTYFGPLALDTSYDVTITVTNANGDTAELTFATISTNDLPVVFAGDNTSTFLNMFPMSATASDPQLRPLSYSWVNTSWPPPPAIQASFDDATILNPTVNFHSHPGDYAFMLTASNGRYSASSTVIIDYEQTTFAFLGSFTGIDNSSGNYGSPGFYYGLASMTLREDEVATIVWDNGGSAIYYTGPGVTPGTVASAIEGPYNGPGTFNFYSAVADGWQGTAESPDTTVDISADVTVVATNAVTNEPAGTTVNSNPQTGTTIHSPILPATLVITIDFGAGGQVVLTDVYGNNSLVMTSNTTSFVYNMTSPSVNYSTGVWSADIVESPPDFNPIPAGGVITVSYGYQITTNDTYDSTRLLPNISLLAGEQTSDIPYAAGPWGGASGAFSGCTFTTQGIAFLAGFGPWSDANGFDFYSNIATVISGAIQTRAQALIPDGPYVLFSYAISGTWDITAGDGINPPMPRDVTWRSLTEEHFVYGTLVDDSGLPQMPGSVSGYNFGAEGLPFTGPPNGYWMTGTIGS